MTDRKSLFFLSLFGLLHLQALYGLGARKMVINNIWPLGCTPGFTNPLDPTAICCNEAVNKLVRPYSEALPSILQNLQWNLTGVHFSVSNDFEFVAVVKKNPEKYGEEYPKLRNVFLSSKN